VDDSDRLSDQWVVAHSGFHKALVGACGSAKILQIRGQLYEQSERYRRYSAPLARIKRDISGEHRRIFDAAISRDSGAAAAAITEHLNATAAIIITSPLLESERAFARKSA
jgi:DNA-binding GntR family transcriptional regulator